MMPMARLAALGNCSRSALPCQEMIRRFASRSGSTGHNVRNAKRNELLASARHRGGGIQMGQEAKTAAYLKSFFSSSQNQKRWASSAHFVQQPTLTPSGLDMMLPFDADATPAIFHAPWLWENDPAHLHSSSGQRTRSGIFSLGARIRSVRVLAADELSQTEKEKLTPPPPPFCLHSTASPLGNEHSARHSCMPRENGDARVILRVEWQLEGVGPSLYDMDWLRRCHCDQEAIAEHARSPAHLETLRANDMLTAYRFMDVIDNDETLLNLLSTILSRGAALVSQAPDSYRLRKKTVESLGVRLGGYLSHGQLYGNTFDVQSKPNAQNIAYTNVELAPHQDLAYYESPPGLQLLHCISNKAQGGESKLIDALSAANEFRDICPDLFEILCENEATFMKQREGADMLYRRSHIRVDSHSNVVSVHWSPPFEGPVLIDQANMKNFYVARSAFNRMLDNSLPLDHRFLPMLDESVEAKLRDYSHSYTWEHRLEAGEILVFNNQRMLHGRKAFDIGSDGERHLSGCYTNIDDTLNIFRMLRRRKLDREEGQTRNTTTIIGNGSSPIQ